MLSKNTSPYHVPEIWQYFSIISSGLTPSNVLDRSIPINLLPKVLVTLKIPPVRSFGLILLLYSQTFFLSLPIEYSQKTSLTFSQTKPLPTNFIVRYPNDIPLISISANLIKYSVLLLKNFIVKQDEILEQAVLSPKSTCISKLPQVQKSFVRMKKEEIGGWWNVCSMKMGMPPSRPWKVSPRIGLNGLRALGKQEVRKTKLIVTNFICSTILVALTASLINLGKYPIILASTSNMEVVSKIQTGRDMFMMDLPAIRFDPICFRIIFKMPFCAFIASQSQKTRLPLVSFHLPP